jgi:hypothetical protein
VDTLKNYDTRETSGVIATVNEQLYQGELLIIETSCELSTFSES